MWFERREEIYWPIWTVECYCVATSSWLDPTECFFNPKLAPPSSARMWMNDLYLWGNVGVFHCLKHLNCIIRSSNVAFGGASVAGPLLKVTQTGSLQAVYKGLWGQKGKLAFVSSFPSYWAHRAITTCHMLYTIHSTKYKLTKYVQCKIACCSKSMTSYLVSGSENKVDVAKCCSRYTISYLQTTNTDAYIKHLSFPSYSC